jgi:serine/threonine protein kinase
MGEVYRAHDSKLGRDVAIKTLPVEFSRDSDRLARFRREARTLALLNHPNIASIYGLEESGEVECLVLELVEGETLRGPLPIERALDYAGQVAHALEAAHDKGNGARQAFPIGGGTPVRTGNIDLHWAPDGKLLSLSGGAIIPLGRSYVVPLPPGQTLPNIPAAGFGSEQEVASLPGARRINETEVIPGPSPDVYAFYRGAAQRNLYRIPIP